MPDQKCRIPGPLWPTELASASHGCQALRHTGGLDPEAAASEPSTRPGGSPHLGAPELCLPLQGPRALTTTFSHWTALSRESTPVHALSHPVPERKHVGAPRVRGAARASVGSTNGLVSGPPHSGPAEARAPNLPGQGGARRGPGGGQGAG